MNFFIINLSMNNTDNIIQNLKYIKIKFDKNVIKFKIIKSKK